MFVKVYGEHFLYTYFKQRILYEVSVYLNLRSRVARPFPRSHLSIGNYKRRATRVWNSSRI